MTYKKTQNRSCPEDVYIMSHSKSAPVYSTNIVWQTSPYMMKSPTYNGYIDDRNITEIDLHMAPP